VTAVHDGTDLTFGVGDILDIHAGVSGTRAFRMRVDRREEDAAANVVAVGPQLAGARREGRARRVTLVHAGQYDVVATPRTETTGQLDTATIKWLGAEFRAKWYTARDWYLSGGVLRRPGGYLVAAIAPSPDPWPDAIRAVTAGWYKHEADARARAGAVDAPEVWICTHTGATRIKPAPDRP
jgi:hypothetical protein